MLRRFLYVLALLLVAGLLASAWYVSGKGFTRKWRSFIVAEFRKAGVEIRIRRLTLDPFHGLVAREVSVLDGRDRKRVIAWVDEMLLGVNYAGAIKGDAFLDSADLHDANLWLPLDAQKPDGPKVTISKLNARVFLPPKQIYLAQAQAEAYGIQLFASGRLINPQEWRSNRKDSLAVVGIGSQVVEELSKLTYGGEAPVLSLDFFGDLAVPGGMQVDLRFSGREVRRKKYELRTLDLNASFRKGVVEVQHFSASDASGEGRLTGTYDLAGQELSLQARSGLDLAELDRAFRWFPHLANWILPQAPEVTLRAEGTLGAEPAVRVTGHAELQHATYRRVPLQWLSTDFSWQPDAWSLRDFHLSHASGEISGDITRQPQLLRARITSTLSPRHLAPLLEPGDSEWLSRFDFQEPPVWNLEVNSTSTALETCTGTGQIGYTQLLYHGEAIAPASSSISLGGGVLRLAPFTPQKGEAKPSALVYNLQTHEARYENEEEPTKVSPSAEANTIGSEGGGSRPTDKEGE